MELLAKAVEENVLLKYQEFNRLLNKLRSLNEGISIIGRIILTGEDLGTRTETGRTGTFFHHKFHME
jgi:hypothetical protein